MILRLSNNRGNSLLLVLFLLAAATVTIISLQGQVTSGAKDISAYRGRYLAESTARSCVELAYADTLDLLSSGYAVGSPVRYGEEYFPPIRGRSLSCTATISLSNATITIQSTALTTGAHDHYEASHSKRFSRQQ